MNNNLHACVERKPSVTRNPFATFFALNISGFSSAVPSLLPALPCLTAALEQLFWSRCQAQPRQLWLDFSAVDLSSWCEVLNTRRTLPSRGRRDFSGAATEINPKGVRFFMSGASLTHLQTTESENGYVHTTDQLRSYYSST